MCSSSVGDVKKAGVQPVRILVSAAFPFSIRNFIATGLLSDLQRELGASLDVVSPYTEAAIALPCGVSVPNHWVPARQQPSGLPQPEMMTWRDDIIRAIHQTGFAQEYPDGSLLTMQQNNPRKPKWWIARLLRFFAPQYTRRRNWARACLYARRPRRRRIEQIFQNCQPQLLVVASPGHYSLDQILMEEAARRGVPVVCIVLSWDNMYSRGPLIRRPDLLAVWSEEMRRQAIEVHQYPPEKIRVVGSLQFGFYDAPLQPAEIMSVRERLGLLAQDKYIAYVCGSRTAHYDCEDVMALLGVLRESQFASYRLVLRPHPQGDRRVYESLKVHGVIFDESPDITGKTAPVDVVDRQAARHMAAFLSDAAFVVSSWGTTALLEACLFDRPAIQLRWYDSVAHSKPSEVKAVRQFQRYLHMRKFDDSQARLFSDSPADFLACVDLLKVEHVLYSERRRQVVNLLVQMPLGEANRRVVRACRDALALGVS